MQLFLFVSRVLWYFILSKLRPILTAREVTNKNFRIRGEINVFVRTIILTPYPFIHPFTHPHSQRR